MADTYTSSLLLTQPEVGENINVWGNKLNSMFALVDTAVAGRTNYTLSGSKTLTRSNGAADEARSRFQDITGGTGGTVTIPSVPAWYLVRNNSSGTVTFTTGGDTVANIEADTVSFIVCDGANVYAPNLDGYVEQVEALVAEAAEQVDLAAAQVALAADQVTLATTQANNAATSATNAANSAIAAAASAAAAATFDPTNFYTKANTYSKTETDNLLTPKANLASPTFTGTPAGPTAAAGTNTTQLATTAFVQGLLASPALTGSPTAPTPTAGDNDTSIATTAFVANAISSGGLPKVVAAMKTDTASTSSTSWADTGLSVTITLGVSTSRVLLSAAAMVGTGSGSVLQFFRFVRSSTAVTQGDAASTRTQGHTASNPTSSTVIVPIALEAVDSPGSVGPHTYKLQWMLSAAGTSYLNRSGSDTDAAASLRGVSTLMATEIGA